MVLCVAFDDAGAVEDAFERAYGALIDTDQSARCFEETSGDLERAYDAWVDAALARATAIPDISHAGRGPGGSAEGAPPSPTTRRRERRKFSTDSSAGSAIGRRVRVQPSQPQGASPKARTEVRQT